MRLPRIERIWRSLAAMRSIPSNDSFLAEIVAAFGVSFRIVRPVSDLPEPDSPTMPTFSRPTLKEMPRTACTVRCAPLKVTERSSTSSSGLSMARIQNVAQAVAEQVEGQAGDED